VKESCHTLRRCRHARMSRLGKDEREHTRERERASDTASERERGSERARARAHWHTRERAKDTRPYINQAVNPFENAEPERQTLEKFAVFPSSRNTPHVLQPFGSSEHQTLHIAERPNNLEIHNLTTHPPLSRGHNIPLLPVACVAAHR